jgi:hypothetical protein
MMATRAVGKDVDSWCPKCKLILAHTVEAMVGERITRVHCNTCKAPHMYRANPPGTSARRGAAARSGAAALPDYAKLMRGRDPAKARRYATSERFAASDLLDHPTFGLGIVIGVKDGNKIEVVFENGSKVLVHAR